MHANEIILSRCFPVTNFHYSAIIVVIILTSSTASNRFYLRVREMQLGLGEIEERQLPGWIVHLVEGIGLQIDAVLDIVHFRVSAAGQLLLDGLLQVGSLEDYYLSHWRCMGYFIIIQLIRRLQAY